MTRDTLRGDYRDIIGESRQIFEVLQQIEHFAATSLKVLISGETGTGKELIARALHKNSGRSGAMISINCAAVPENLWESELFGHEKGAFTSAEARHTGRFERADEGTLFLDEIGEMPLSMQPKLLRAIEGNQIERLGGEKSIPVDVRIVAATNRDLAQAVRDGTFRSDLYYRLNVATIALPPLSERRGDIEMLVAHFLKKHRGVSKLEVLQVAASTLTFLKPIPGLEMSGNWRMSLREGLLWRKMVFSCQGIYEKISGPTESNLWISPKIFLYLRARKSWGSLSVPRLKRWNRRLSVKR